MAKEAIRAPKNNREGMSITSADIEAMNEQLSPSRNEAVSKRNNSAKRSVSRTSSKNVGVQDGNNKGNRRKK